MARLILTRDKAFAGILRPMKILLDGQAAGSVWRGGTADIAVPAGEHALLVQVGWLRSHPVGFTADEHDRLRAGCGFRGYGGSLRLWLEITGHDQLVW